MTTAELRSNVSKTTEGIAAGLLGENGIDAIMQTFATFLEELELPKYHEDHDIPFDNLDAQEIGEVIGYEECAEECRQAITQAANELKGQDNG